MRERLDDLEPFDHLLNVAVELAERGLLPLEKHTALFAAQEEHGHSRYKH